jgi:hypothetical protein
MNIKFSGSLSKEEFQAASKLLRYPSSGFHVDGWVILFIIGIATMIWGFKTLFMELNINSGAFITTVGLVLTMYGYKIRTDIKKAWDEAIKSNSNFEGIATEESLELRNSDSEAKISWTAFSAYAADKKVVVLIKNNIGQIYSRSMFNSDDDWNSFIETVSQKIPPFHKNKTKKSGLRTAIFIAIIILINILIVISGLRNGAR